MPDLNADSLAFLAPGLVHQLGNHLFALQGQAQLLPEAHAELRQSMLAAVARSGEVVRLLRAIVGDPAPPRLPPEQALAPLLEVARVALRERGHQLVWHGAHSGGSDQADAATVVVATAQALTALVAALPDGLTGTFTVECDTSPAATILRVRFTARAGALPFPLGLDGIDARLAAAAAGAARGQVTWRGRADGIELSFPGRPGSCAGEA